MSPVARFAAVAKRYAILALLAALPLLAGCGALGKIGAGSHNPPASVFTVSARVTAVVINGGSGSIDVTGSSRSTVAVSQQVTYSGKPPTVAHALRGTTLTLSYSCPSELLCGVSYAVQVPASVTVTVATGTGQVTLTSLAGTVTGGSFLEVRDNGPGMDDDRIHRVLHGGFTTKENGTGLGLSICRHLTGSHGGTFSIESRPGAGTTVRLTFPAVARK